MHPHLVHGFMDGGYLRARAKGFGRELVDPRKLAQEVVNSVRVLSWAAPARNAGNAVLARVTYYDALADDNEATSAGLDDYWRAVELLDDTHLGFGKLKGTGRKLRQKAVDTLIATDMLVGAFSGLFDIALLVSGDADFVPVIEEVKRRGVMVVLAAFEVSVDDDLRRVADRYVEITLDHWHPMTEGAGEHKRT